MMKKPTNLPAAALPVARLQKLELDELKAAVDVLRPHSSLSVKDPTRHDVAVKRVVQLRLDIAKAKAGDGHETIQDLAEALLQAEVLPGVGLSYEEVLHLCREAFPDAGTGMNSVRWYASKLNKRLTEEKKKGLPARPPSAAAPEAEA